MGNDSSKHSDRSRDEGAKKSQGSGVISALKPGPSNSTVQKHLEMAKKSRVLSLKASNLKTVPDAVLEVAPLIRSLDLSQNRLQSLRHFFGEFEMLKQLHLNDNALVSLPDELGNLKKLEVLNLSGNQLTSLPDTLIGCMALNHLNLSNNQFREFPIVVCLLPRADIVDVSHNNIQELPDEIGKITASELNLNNNKLIALNPSLSLASRLRVLRVKNNQLPKQVFTKEVLENSQLSLIEFENNNFQRKDFQDLSGYEKYEERFTAMKRKGVY